MESTDLHDSLDGIAVIGIACRFPGARDVDEFWENIRNGVETISFFTEEELIASGVEPDLLTRPNYVKAASVLKDIDLFDASFFGYTPREAETMDPQQRLFLECAWEALEHAGYDPETDKRLIGLYLGAGDNDYILNIYAHRELYETLGSNQVTFNTSGDHINLRTSYKLNLTGPSINIRAACASSLVAVSMACQSLANYQCDIMLAGGISLDLSPNLGYLHQNGSVQSPDGHCRAFDEQAQGTIFGNGLGTVVLKRLEDAVHDRDTIYAVIKGWAISNDGSAKVGYTAPGINGQSAAIMEAQSLAQIDPATITYIEAHGTGTVLGDPVEIAALTRAFRASTDKKEYCAIGSIKTGMGHLNHAAGIAGLIKTSLMLKHKMLTPTLHFQKPNPQIDFANSPFYVNTETRPWETIGVPRRAGVSSFGIGGVNAHVVLEEAPVEEQDLNCRSWQLLLLSARTPAALEQMTANLTEHLDKHPAQNLADIAYTLQVGRRRFTHSRALVCCNHSDALALLRGEHPSRLRTTSSKVERVVFLFPGQGAQYHGMAGDLYREEAVFRQQIDRCAQLLTPLLAHYQSLVEESDHEPAKGNMVSRSADEDLRTLLFDSKEEQASGRLRQTQITQPVLFMLEYALAQLWISWGIHPDAMLGHSVGEYVAACLAGVFTLEEALQLIVARGHLMQQTPEGGMLAISLSVEEVHPFLDEHLSLSTINSPSQCVVAGPLDRIDNLQIYLTMQGIKSQRLETSHAFHSCLMNPILDAFRQEVERVHLHPPTQRYISNVTGSWITDAEATDPDYWVRHLRQTVLFSRGVQTILQETDAALLEVGPGNMLKTLIQQQISPDTDCILLSSLRRKQEQVSDVSFLLQTLGALWMAGVQINWEGVYAYEQRRRIPLPTYPFERQRYWLDAQDQQSAYYAATHVDQPLHLTNELNKLQAYHRPALQTLYVAPSRPLEQTICSIWEKLFGIQPIGIHDDFFDLGGHSLLAIQLISLTNEACGIELTIQNLFETPTVAGLTQKIMGLRQEDEPDIPSSISAVDLEAEVVLDAAITLEQVEPFVHLTEPATLLLSGATGFIGTFLLHDLLQQTKAVVYCLIRASSIQEAKQHIQKQLKVYHLWQEDYSTRIVPILGDLTQPLLGLAVETFDLLAKTIDVIYHNGARVNFLYPYQTLKPANVLGTHEILRLASRTKVKPVHYISSTAVFELDDYAEETLWEETPPRYNRTIQNVTGYAQSKWVAEQLVLTYRARGFPASIYRPGTVTGHSKTGVSKVSDLWYRLLIGCLQIEAFPLINMDWDITPVDYVSKTIVHLSQQERSYGQIFHLVNPSLIPWQEIVHCLHSFGYRLPCLPFSSWHSVLEKEAALSEESSLQALLQVLTKDGYPDQNITSPAVPQRRASRYNSKNTVDGVKGTFIACPSVDTELIGVYLAYLVSEQLIKAPENPFSKEHKEHE